MTKADRVAGSPTGGIAGSRLARPRRIAALLGAAAGLAVSACSLPIQAEMDEASDIARYATRYDHVVGPETDLLGRALAECPEKTVKAETGCVARALAGSGLPPQRLAAMVPHCAAGQVCHYERTTHDRLGFVRASATDYVKRWRIDLDFRKPAADAAHVPVTVIDRDDFDSLPPAPAKPG